MITDKRAEEISARKALMRERRRGVPLPGPASQVEKDLSALLQDRRDRIKCIRDLEAANERYCAEWEAETQVSIQDHKALHEWLLALIIKYVVPDTCDGCPAKTVACQSRPALIRYSEWCARRWEDHLKQEVEA